MTTISILGKNERKETLPSTNTQRNRQRRQCINLHKPPCMPLTIASSALSSAFPSVAKNDPLVPDTIDTILVHVRKDMLQAVLGGVMKIAPMMESLNARPVSWYSIVSVWPATLCLGLTVTWTMRKPACTKQPARGE
ncbi:hypothetical protein BDW67DRAFT_149220 [Aspergillus spinulosporus]